MVSAVNKIRGWADEIRGMDEKYKTLALNGLPQGADLSVMACYSFISLWRMGITFIVFIIQINIAGGFNYHTTCKGMCSILTGPVSYWDSFQLAIDLSLQCRLCISCSILNGRGLTWSRI